MPITQILITATAASSYTGTSFSWKGDSNWWTGWEAGGDSVFSDPAPANPNYDYPTYTGKTRNFTGSQYMISPVLNTSGAWSSNAIAIDFWFLPTANGVQLLSEVGSQTPDAGYQYSVLEINSNNTVSAHYYNGTPITSTNTVTLNQWNHIYFAEAANGSHTFELNGVATTGLPTYTRSGPGNTNEYFIVGATTATFLPNGNTGRFQGKIGWLTISDYPAGSTYSATVSNFPAITTYTLSATGGNTTNEGNGQGFNVTGTNITNGTYYWTIENRISEFATISGSFTITSNNGSFTVTAISDSIAEDMEAYQIAVRSGSVTGPILATTGANINNSTGSAAPDGLSSSSPSSSAWKIKQDYPASTDGLYWIQNSNINGGDPVQVYCDMTTDGGGWTLLVQNNYPDGWNNSTTLLRNSTTPPSTLVDYDSTQSADNNYSILGWADYIKKNRSEAASTFDYMIDGAYRRRNGGIWRANQNYSFVGTYDSSSFGTQELGGAGFRKDITEISKFDAGAPGDTATWTYASNTIEARMPYVGQIGGYLPGGNMLLGTDSDGAWWGTIIAIGGWNPVPLLEGVTGSSSINVQSPKVVWYWVR